MEHDIFLDKIALSSILLQKIFVTINSYNNIHRKIRSKDLQETDLYIDEDWQTCWQNLKELYDYIEFEYLDILEQKVTFESKKKPSHEDKRTADLLKQRLKQIFQTYMKNEPLTFDELNFVYEHIRFISTKIGLHNINRIGSSVVDFPKPSGEWNFEIESEKDEI